jgi:predicted permease
MDLPPLDVTDPAGLVLLLTTAARAGHWMLAGAVGVLLAVWALRKWGARLHPVFAGDRAGVILAALTGAVGVVGAGLAAGLPLTADLLAAGVTAGASASGLWQGARRLAHPRDGAQP